MKLYLPGALILLCCFQLSVQDCQESELVQCFINFLDELSWTLYLTKQSVITVSDNQCDALSDLKKCLEDAPGKYRCSHNELIDATQAVTDLLAQKQHSGNFLRSYYLLNYACSEEGREIVRGHRECLENQKIGSMILEAGTYLADRFSENDKDYCNDFKSKLEDFVTSMHGICPGRGPQLMFCNSVKRMLHGMYTQDEGCEFDCADIVKQAAGEMDDMNEYVAPTIDFQSEGVSGDTRADPHVAAEPAAGTAVARSVSSGFVVALLSYVLFLNI